MITEPRLEHFIFFGIILIPVLYFGFGYVVNWYVCHFYRYEPMPEDRLRVRPMNEADEAGKAAKRLTEREL